MFMSIGYQGYATNIKINIFTPGAEIDIYDMYVDWSAQC